MTRNPIITVMMALLLLLASRATAQVVTTSPAIVTTDSSPIIVTFHADRGSRGLAGAGPSEAVYAHTGVITSASGSLTDWQHAPQWLDNDPKYRLTYAGPDTWTLTIPSIKEYYGLTDAELASVTKLMFVFRNANGSREGKTAGGGDIAVDVRPAGFYVTVTCSSATGVVTSDAPLTFTASSADDATVTLSVNGTEATGTGSATLTASFTTPGLHKATARAVLAGGAEATDTLSLLRLAATATAPYPTGEVRQGAVVADNLTSATFALAAPGKKSVMLVGSWNDFALDPSQQMTLATETVTLPSDTSYIKNAWSLKQPYFWTTVEGLQPDREYTYYYIVDGDTPVGDPYARLVLDPSADRFISPDVYPDMPEYPTGKVPDNTILAVVGTAAPAAAPSPLTDRPDPDRLIIYELLIRDFTGNGDGSGTIAGVMDHLDYIASLGVNAVELMPVMEFSGNNSWGYNPLFYFAPDKAYGTPADYRRLVEAIHDRGMAVILDVVFNHADERNPRNLMYAPAENPFFNATPPHDYNVFRDWNQDNPLVLSQWIDILRYWVAEYGVDGFRFDLVKGMGDNGSYGIAWDRATNSFATPSATTTNRYNASRVERIGRIKEALAAYAPDTYFICEDLADAQEDRGLAALGAMDWANINHGACQWAMGWSDKADLSRFYAPRDGGRPAGSTVSYAESHDEERTAYKQTQWGVAAVKNSPEQQVRRLATIAAFMLLSPGAHMIWQFEELGDRQPAKASDGSNNTSPRSPSWSLLDNPLNASLRDTYSRLLTLRNDNPALFASDTEVSISAIPANWNTGYILTLASADGSRLALLANPLPDRELAIVSPLAGDGAQVILSSAGIDTPVLGSDGKITLAPGAFAVIGNAGVAGATLPSVTSPAATPTLYTIGGIRVDSGATLAPGVYISVDPSGSATKIVVR